MQPAFDWQLPRLLHPLHFSKQFGPYRSAGHVSNLKIIPPHSMELANINYIQSFIISNIPVRQPSPDTPEGHIHPYISELQYTVSGLQTS